ncbi:MAG TPA: glycosyltransferase family 4 protein [Phycisphaerae bacterium]|nr:glycosyltransferase family 4 protein [Phycisphaerae bacterium]
MQITIINQFYVPDISPTAHLSASLAEGLAANRHAVTVVTSQGGYVQASRVERKSGANPRIYRVWTPRLGKKTILKRCIDYASFYLLATWRMLRLPSQDVIISLTTPPYIAWTAVIHRLLHPRTKIVLWNMDCYPDAAERAGVLKRGGLASRCMRAMNRSLFRRLDHLICLDAAMADLLLSQYGPGQGRLAMTIIPNFEKAALFPAARPVAPWAEAEKIGLSDTFVLLYLGNAGVGHPFETVIEAAKRLREKPVAFLFVGGGKRFAWLEEARKREGLKNLLLYGYVQKEMTSSVMASADCALITLADEMLGVMSPSKMHANLASSLPIVYVGPKTSNVDEAIERFGCGVSLRGADVDGLVRFVDEALQEPQDFAAKRHAARRAFETAYCDLRALPQFERVIASLFVEGFRDRDGGGTASGWGTWPHEWGVKRGDEKIGGLRRPTQSFFGSGGLGGRNSPDGAAHSPPEPPAIRPVR